MTGGLQVWLGRAQRLTGFLRARLSLPGCAVAPWVCVTGKVRVVADSGAVTVGRSVVLCGGLTPTELIATSGAKLRIGSWSVINHGVRLQALGTNISIGERCLVASGVRILALGARPTKIGDDVWIAHGAVIESGVQIGAGSVVGAGAVVTEDVPEHSLALGSPARAVPLALMTAAASPCTTGVMLPSLGKQALAFAARTVQRGARGRSRQQRGNEAHGY